MALGRIFLASLLQLRHEGHCLHYDNEFKLRPLHLILDYHVSDDFFESDLRCIHPRQLYLLLAPLALLPLHALDLF